MTKVLDFLIAVGLTILLVSVLLGLYPASDYAKLTLCMTLLCLLTLKTRGIAHD